MSKMSKDHLIGQVGFPSEGLVVREKQETRVMFTRSRSGKLPSEDVWSDQGQSPEATRHYKISNQSKFLIQGPQMPQHSFLMEKVIDSRTLPDGSMEYLIKWKGQKLHLCQWLKEIDQDLITRYEADLRAGKTQSGKGTYSYKRALRREAKAIELAAQEPSQKLRNPRLHQNRSIALHRHSHKLASLEPLDPIACAASVRKRHSKIANGSDPGAEESGSSSFDDSRFFSPRPMYWQPRQHFQPPRFYPQPNQNFEAKVFKPVRPVLQKSRTLPSFHFERMSSKSFSFITPVPIYPSQSATNSTDEKGAFQRADEPDRIEGHFCDSEGRKFIIVGWKPKKDEDTGEFIQPSPTTYALEHFPEDGHKLLIEYLVQKVPFTERGVSSRSDNADGRSQSKEKKYQDKEEGEEQIWRDLIATPKKPLMKVIEKEEEENKGNKAQFD